MIGVTVRTRSDIPKVIRKARKANIVNLAHAGAAIRLTARRSIRKSKKSSPAGSPPHTRQGLMRRAILYGVEKEKQRVTIGPAYSKAGPSAMAHEHGGRFRGRRYKKRAFMGPALKKMKSKLPRKWAGSIK